MGKDGRQSNVFLVFFDWHLSVYHQSLCRQFFNTADPVVAAAPFFVALRASSLDAGSVSTGLIEYGMCPMGRSSERA